MLERRDGWWCAAAGCSAQVSQALDRALAGAGIAYFSGISVAILSDRGRANLRDALARARAAGTMVVFDPNLRPRLWPDAAAMRAGIEAAAAGTVRVRVKMAAAVELARLFTPGEVDWALGHAAVHGRFAEADLASILDHHQQARGPEHRAGENASLTQGTHGWSRYGTSEEVNQ